MHKVLRAYINMALADGYKLTNPYPKFKYNFQPGFREPLEADEVEKLKALLDSPQLGPVGNEVLKKFLFSCYTGLRISDNALFNTQMIRQWKMHIDLKKGANFGKRVHVLLPDFARAMIEDRKGIVFASITDQACNRWLKVIAHMAGIEKKLTFHVSRDTFGTGFIDRVGDVYTLMGLMGHSDIKTTTIYLSASVEHLRSQMTKHPLND